MKVVVRIFGIDQRDINDRPLNSADSIIFTILREECSFLAMKVLQTFFA